MYCQENSREPVLLTDLEKASKTGEIITHGWHQTANQSITTNPDDFASSIVLRASFESACRTRDILVANCFLDSTFHQPMTALGLDLNGSSAPEKISTEPHSDDDADSDFDDGGSQKRRPRVRRPEDIDDEHTEEPVEASKKNAWEISPSKAVEADPWADPVEPGGGKSGNTPAKGSNARGGGRGNHPQTSESRGRGGARGRGDRGRGGNERGRGAGDRGRGTGERGRGGDRARSERGRGRGNGRGAAPTMAKDPAPHEPVSAAPPPPPSTETVPNPVSEEPKVAPTAVGEGTKSPKPKRPKGKRPEKAQEEAKPLGTADESWKLPTAEEGGWGAAADAGWGAEPQEANAPAKSPTSARSPGGWTNATPTEGTDPNKPFKRVPAYVNTDRVKTGGSERVCRVTHLAVHY